MIVRAVSFLWVWFLVVESPQMWVWPQLRFGGSALSPIAQEDPSLKPQPFPPQPSSSLFPTPLALFVMLKVVPKGLEGEVPPSSTFSVQPCWAHTVSRQVLRRPRLHTARRFCKSFSVPWSTRIQGVTLRLKPFHLRGFQLISLIFIHSAGFMVFFTKNRYLSKGNTRHSAVSTLSRVSEGSCKGNTWNFSIFQRFYSVLIINVFCWHCRSPMESLFLVGIKAKEEGETEKREEE